MGLVEFAGWLATQVFDVVGSVAGAPAEPADGGSGDVDLQVGKTVFHDVPAKVSGQGRGGAWRCRGCAMGSRSVCRGRLSG
jgi:hypothetical protein